MRKLLPVARWVRCSVFLGELASRLIFRDLNVVYTESLAFMLVVVAGSLYVVGTARETRAMIALMVALAVVLSSYGFYQVFIGLPADRAAYAENPEGLLRSLGQWSPPGSCRKTTLRR